MSRFTAADVPAQAGRLAVVTGANSGLGYETALALAQAGAMVVVAARDEAKGRLAVGRIAGLAPGARISFEKLDLASLDSIAGFAVRIAETHGSLDILVNNAGVMMPPARRVTEDGFELQFGTNYLGHFALTARLFPLLRKAPAPRVVQLSSIAHRSGLIDFNDLQSMRYRPWKAYAQSKLAMLIFALELQRRSDAQGWHLCSVAAHPGISRTELIANGPGANGVAGLGSRAFFRLFGQSAAAGALPVLFAATSPDVLPGGYYGPAGFREMKGPPGAAEIRPQALDTATAARLWEISEALTRISF